MTAYTPVTNPTNTGGNQYPPTNPLETEYHLETKEEQAVRAFPGDPEHAFKIFFTPYFINNGLMWLAAPSLTLVTR